jgi:hypothetical protein
MSYEENQENGDRLSVDQPKSQQWEHPSGKNEKHTKRVNAEILNKEIIAAQTELAKLKASGGPTKEKRYWKQQIKHLRKQLEKRGTEDSRMGKNQNQRMFR